jgi:hypothetical protein
MRLWQQAVYLYGNNQAFKYVSKMATGPSLPTFRNRRASWNKYALNQFKTVNRESYVPELDARGLSKSALISRRTALSLSLSLSLSSDSCICPRNIRDRNATSDSDAPRPVAIAGDAVRDACRRCFRITRRPWRNAGADREMVLMRWGMLPWSQSGRRHDPQGRDRERARSRTCALPRRLPVQALPVRDTRGTRIPAQPSERQGCRSRSSRSRARKYRTEPLRAHRSFITSSTGASANAP